MQIVLQIQVNYFHQISIKRGGAVTQNEWAPDYNVVLAAVTQDGHWLEHAMPEMQNDYNIVMAAVTQNGKFLGNASPDLQNKYFFSPSLTKCVTLEKHTEVAITTSSWPL